MSPNASKSLCVSIHDVAPATWPDCQRLIDAVRAVADIPLTMLVVPQYHESTAIPRHYEKMLDKLLADGHELALHGYTHLDSAAAQKHPGDRFFRQTYARMEGEFAAIPTGEARRRLELGLAWFARRNWPVSGFVAPAWLLSAGSWTALQEFPFDYTTTWGRFYLLPDRQSLLSPSLVYTARNPPGRLLSPYCADVIGAFLKMSPLTRLSLHPPDVHYPGLVKHFQRLLERLLAARQPVTKGAFARRWRQQVAGLDFAANHPTESRF